MPTEARRAAVVGSPVAHSLSPVLHDAAYRALGLTGWRYERVEADAAALPALVSSLDESYVGLSVTMPGKQAALSVATDATARAAAVGCGTGHGVVVGAGGTACAALAGFADLGIARAYLVARDPDRAEAAVRCASKLGLPVEVVRWASAPWESLAGDAAVLVNTVPAAGIGPHVPALALAPCVLDVIYHPWPTPLATAVSSRGGRLATGLDMLLHQAFGQVEQFTGREAPRTAMRDALREATGNQVPLPL